MGSPASGTPVSDASLASPSFGNDSGWREMGLVLLQSLRRVAYSTSFMLLMLRKFLFDAQPPGY
jgi:hypothetical protein